MAKKPRHIDQERLYVIVENLRAAPRSNKNKTYNFTDPTTLRALQIHRHLLALEDEILENHDKQTISLEQGEGHIRIAIQNDEVHCCRVSYLTEREYRLLRQNRKVANVLRRCACKSVA